MSDSKRGAGDLPTSVVMRRLDQEGKKSLSVRLQRRLMNTVRGSRGIGTA
jgi:hypothetical protein